MIVETIREVTTAGSGDTSETSSTDRKRKASEDANQVSNDVPREEKPSTKRRHTEDVVPEVEDVLDDITGADDTLVGHEAVHEEQHPAPVVPSSPASKPEPAQEDETTRKYKWSVLGSKHTKTRPVLQVTSHHGRMQLRSRPR